MSVCVRTTVDRLYRLVPVQPHLTDDAPLDDDELLDRLVTLRSANGDGFPSIPLAAVEVEWRRMCVVNLSTVESMWFEP